MMKIYTGKGDKGETSLIGKRVSKDDLRVEAYGTVDELNSFIGYARTLTKDKTIDSVLEGVQEDLFVIGAELATEKKIKSIPTITVKELKDMEEVIDNLTTQIKPINKFVLPTGTQAASIMHIARTVCRRAERKIVSLSKKEKINPEIVRYINRLSSLLFVLARLENEKSKVEEEIWEGKVKI